MIKIAKEYRCDNFTQNILVNSTFIHKEYERGGG